MADIPFPFITLQMKKNIWLGYESFRLPRVSTNGQEDNTSIKSQCDSIESFFHSQDWELTKTFMDIASGSTLDRPGFQELKKMLSENGFDGMSVRNAWNFPQGYEA